MLLAVALTLGLHVKPCTQGKSNVPALCGTYGVYENRDAKSGRIIPLNIIVLKAKHPTHRAIAEIAGGPGQAATEFAPFAADGKFFNTLAALRDSYDIVFMDDRGMGASNGLICDFDPQTDPAAYFKQIIPQKQLDACHAKLASASDLSKYNTNNTVDDLDDVRAALGYPKLVLDGGSYGTFFSMVYLRRHPDHVQSAVLDGVTAPGFQPLPGEPLGAQTALDDLIVKWRRDAACNKAYPLFADHFDALVQRLNHGPIQVTLKRKGKPTVTVALSKEVFVDRIRELFYDPESAAYVPFAIEETYRGNTVPLAKLIDLITRGLDDDQSMGAWLSYTCADWIPFLDDATIANAAAHSFTGDLRIQAQRKACATWNVPAMPADFNEPVRSNAPVLMIMGSDDPATPPQYGEGAAKYLPNAAIVLVKGAGHGADNACTDALVERFVRASSAKGLDVTKCSGTFAAPKFATSLAGLPPG